MKSQRQRILAYLLKGHSISPMRALYMFNCFRLSGRILELRKAHYNIHTEMVTVGQKTFAKYSLLFIHAWNAYMLNKELTSVRLHGDYEFPKPI